VSFDLMAFEKAKAPRFYEDFLNWTAEQTEWTEERDYNSVDGTASPLVSWFMEMIKTFPPLNGPYRLSDEDAFASIEAENHLTDYSIGSSIIYAAFGWSVAEEACELAATIAAKHGVGFFNPQTAEVHCDGMIQCKIRLEDGRENAVTWEQIEREISTLDNPERGTSNRDCAFVTIWFEQNGTDNEFMQCIPRYPKPENFIKKLFRSSKAIAPSVLTYTVEVSTGDKIYSTQVNTKEQAAEILHEYYSNRKLPDTTSWEDTGIL
jgi:hypothetical protein